MSATTAAERMTIVSSTPPSTPRLRMEPTGARRTLLDGAWWPRSTDPVAELPGLVLAIDKLRGPVTRLVLAAGGWDSHPRRLGVAGRVLRLGYFSSQPVSLLTAICGNDRVDLLVVPPNTDGGTADAAMILAATATNLVHAPHILLAATTAAPDRTADEQERWHGSRIADGPDRVGVPVHG
ncbi:DUF5994 family protein [Phytohabitans houttuyneae]|uniref:Uncharacterized protein n=1 Tax=Phytohabitans houttuyneae TaxID=1076126 RepID=A0A6V8KTA1_9ACTN|nr:DUF5994 family protein [Phytohabitans houttuyneae]GFJ85086.1 hypothetical protein Phou_092660 [Phytohabitans houttuyneae]